MTAKDESEMGNEGMKVKKFWEENQGSVEVRKHITEDATMKKTVQNWKVFFELGKKRSELV